MVSCRSPQQQQQQQLRQQAVKDRAQLNQYMSLGWLLALHAAQQL
jgi:hypothetical protein